MNSALSNNVVVNKIRDQFYLRHLRQVEMIKNRQAQLLKKDLQQYKSISEMHKKNRMFSKRYTVQQHNKSVQAKNHEIESKIKSIKSYLNFHQKHPDMMKQRTHSLHYRYRKKQQQEINQQNSRLMKVILSQKSTCLPYLGRGSRLTQRTKANQNASQLKEHNAIQ